MSVDIPSHMYRICLSCKHFELQRFWVAKVLSCKRFELQKFWIAKVLSCKSYELQHFWAAKVLNCKTKVLSFRWDGKLLLTKKVAPNRKEMSSVKNVRLSFGFMSDLIRRSWLVPSTTHGSHLDMLCPSLESLWHHTGFIVPPSCIAPVESAHYWQEPISLVTHG